MTTPYYERRNQPGIPWDAPREWFVNLVFWMAWRSKRPLRTAESRDFDRRRWKPTKRLRESIYQRDGYRCVLCQRDRSLTVDHIVPVCFGGTAHPTNLRTVCEPCNRDHFQTYHAPLLAEAAELAVAA